MTRIAIPIIDNVLSRDFEHCSYYLVYRINQGELQEKPLKMEVQHSTLTLPDLIKEWDITDIIAHRINKISINHFSETKINLFIGVNISAPEELIGEYLKGSLKSNTHLITN